MEEPSLLDFFDALKFHELFLLPFGPTEGAGGLESGVLAKGEETSQRQAVPTYRRFPTGPHSGSC